MKRLLLTATAVLFFLCALPGVSLSGYGRGPGDGSGPVHDICAGVPFALQGDVVGFVRGEGLLLATTDGLVTVFGIGPNFYWDRLQVEKPGVGETVFVEGYIVSYGDVGCYIATEMTIDGVTVTLRDPESCEPLWRRKR